MPAFKPKANKKLPNCQRANITLDSKHNEKMAEFAIAEGQPASGSQGRSLDK